jgi:hypothetical protein
MTDKTGSRWAELVQQLQHCFASHEYTLDAREGVMLSFFNFIRLNLAYKDLLFYDQISSLADLIEARCKMPVIAGPQKELPTTPVEKVESLARMIDCWAQLEVR